jgi:hypothetical protein
VRGLSAMTRLEREELTIEVDGVRELERDGHGGRGAGARS